MGKVDHPQKVYDRLNNSFGVTRVSEGAKVTTFWHKNIRIGQYFQMSGQAEIIPQKTFNSLK